MKNFTNNFKQFTSRLSARWLIMALMLLLGTSSAWGADVYFKNTLGWSNVYAYVRTSGSMWNGNNGVTTNNATRYDMTHIGNNIWKCSTSGSFAEIAFLRDIQDNYGNIWQTQACYNPNYTANKPMFTPNTTSNQTTNETVYFSNGTWSEAPTPSAYSLGGYLNGGDIAYNDTFKLTKQNDGTYKGTFNNFETRTHYFQVFDDLGTKWGVNSYTTLTVGNSTTLSKTNNNEKVGISLTSGTPYVFTFNPSNGSFSVELSCAAPASAPTLSKVSDIVKCGTTTITSGTLEIGTVNTGSTYYYKIGTNGTEQEISLNNKQFTVSSEGDYYVKEVNDCGASSSWSTTEVTISEINNQVSISEIDGPDNICSGNSADYSITDIDGVTYNWSINSDKFTLGTNGSNSVTVTANGTEQASATLTITATKNDCPTPPNSKIINLIPLPTISTVSPREGTVCTGTTISALENTLTITKSANSTTKWYKGVEEKSSTATVETGEYTIKAISNTGSCVSNSSVTYTVTGITTIPTGLTIDINGQPSASICAGTATINAKAIGATSYSLYKGNDELVETKDGNANGVSFTVSETNTYKVKATNNCGSTEFSSGVTLTVNPVPSLTNVGNVTLCSSSTPISVAELIAETKATASNSATIKLYDGNGVEITSPININTQTTTTYKLKASTQTCSSEFVSFSLTVNSLPAAPSLISPDPVCEGTTVNLPTGYNWYDAETDGNKVADTAIEATGTYWAAAVQNGCESATRTRYDVTVNPKPTISISGSETAVLYEDVTLTASATDGAIVKWYEGGAEKGEGLTYVVTSETATSKAVTAKAFLNGCESTAASYTVAFSAEKCSTGKTKIRFRKTYNNNEYYGFNTGSVYLYSWDSETDAKYTGSYPGTLLSKTETIDGITYYVHEFTNAQSTENLTILFRAQYDYSGTLGKTYDIPLSTPGATYQIELKNGDKKKETDDKDSDNSNSIDYFEVNSTPSGGGIIISTPAVKTVSVTSDEDGNVTMVGQVVKTGCDTQAILGLQYKKQKQDGTYDDVNYTTYPNPGTKEAISAGKTFTVTTKLEDGTYMVRARIDNSHTTNGYGEDIIVVVNTVKTPITSVTLTHVKNQAGEPYSAQELANLIYCAGETVWFKLEQNGSKFQDYQWISYPGTDLVGMYAAGTFSFTITDSGNVGIRLKNDANDDWVESNLLEFKTHPVAISPTISFENATICSNSTATLKLGALVVGQSYELYKEKENEGVYSEERVGDVTLTCNSIEDDLEFTGLNKSGKYFVKCYTAQCPDYKVSSQTATLEIVDASSVYITLDPTEATTTPWMPAKFTVNASDKYTLNVTKGNPAETATEAEVSQNGNNVSVKIPLPQGATGGEGQYDNVSFPQDATTSYTVTAKLVSIGGEDNPCAVPATATITLTPYVEDCTIGH